MRNKNFVFLPRGGVDFCFFMGEAGSDSTSSALGLGWRRFQSHQFYTKLGGARGRFLGHGRKGCVKNDTHTQTMKIEDGPVPLKDCIFWMSGMCQKFWVCFYEPWLQVLRGNEKGRFLMGFLTSPLNRGLVPKFLEFGPDRRAAAFRQHVFFFCAP